VRCLALAVLPGACSTPVASLNSGDKVDTLTPLAHVSRTLSATCSHPCSAAVYALTQWLNCSPIYVVNRDDAEVEQFISDFAKSSTAAFKPELVHVKTVEQAEGLDAPAYIVSAVPAFPPVTPEEKQARAVTVTLLCVPPCPSSSLPRPFY